MVSGLPLVERFRGAAVSCESEPAVNSLGNILVISGRSVMMQAQTIAVFTSIQVQ